MQENVFHHQSSYGDIIYSLPTIKALGGGTFLLSIGAGKDCYPFLKPLIEIQPYVKQFVRIEQSQGWNSITHNLNAFRKLSQADTSKHLCFCHAEPFNAKCDFTQPWLTNIIPSCIRPIIISKTTRYKGTNIVWGALKKYQDYCAYIGFYGEYISFMKRTQLNKVMFYEVKDALEMAQVIKGSLLFVGNQSLGFAIAEGLKHPRVLEKCDRISNCMPFTKNGYTILNGKLIQHYLSPVFLKHLKLIKFN